MTWVAVGAELQGDWRNATGEALGQIMGEHLSFYGNLFGSYQAAKGGVITSIVDQTLPV